MTLARSRLQGLCFLSGLMLVLSASSASARDVPVMAGGDATADACPATGEVVGLDPNGDGFLSVRSGPGGRPFVEADRVFNGQRLSVCEARGAWLGVVYDPRGADCGLGTPRSVRQPYTGPCHVGWVSSRYVTMLAGGIRDDVPEAGSGRGDGDNCDALWHRRNAVYREAGYCFRTQRAISAFGNSGCRYDALEDVPLSQRQRREVAEVSSRERSLACAR